jgi:hypothetical protein
MNLHETIEIPISIGMKAEVTRVPNGWIYHYKAYTKIHDAMTVSQIFEPVFVPFSSEFASTEVKIPEVAVDGEEVYEVGKMYHENKVFLGKLRTSGNLVFTGAIDKKIYKKQKGEFVEILMPEPSSFKDFEESKNNYNIEFSEGLEN